MRISDWSSDVCSSDLIEPEAVRALLARIGTSDPVEPIADAGTLIESFDFARFGRAPARFDEEELRALNARIVHQLPYDRVAAALPAGMDAAGWETVRPNLTRVADALDWWHVVEGPIATTQFNADDRPFLAGAHP